MPFWMAYKVYNLFQYFELASKIETPVEPNPQWLNEKLTPLHLKIVEHQPLDSMRRLCCDHSNIGQFYQDYEFYLTENQLL